MKKYSSVEQYHADFSGTVKDKLIEMNSIIRAALPKAEEVISYNMPAFKEEKVLVYYAGYKKHIGFYPTSKPIIVFADELKKYETSKGAIQFPLDKKLPVTLIKKIARYRQKDEAEKAKNTKKK
jgi:uncharacterized protein YdhG (YjbR/CyaY superfamily)